MANLITLVSIFLLVVAAFVVLRVSMYENNEPPNIGDFPTYPPYAY